MVTSWLKACSRKQGISSTQIDKSSMPKACFASKWGGLLPLQPTCEKSTHLKEWDMAIELKTSAATDDGGGDRS